MESCLILGTGKEREEKTKLKDKWTRKENWDRSLAIASWPGRLLIFCPCLNSRALFPTARRWRDGPWTSGLSGEGDPVPSDICWRSPSSPAAPSCSLWMPTRGGECSNGGGFIFMWFKSRYLEKKNVDSIVDFFYTIDTNQPVCINQTIKKRTVFAYLWLYARNWLSSKR